jgi:hypothetical protein
MLSLHEAQELHELIGAALENAQAGELATTADLERARELAAVLVSDKYNADELRKLADEWHEAVEALNKRTNESASYGELADVESPYWALCDELGIEDKSSDGLKWYADNMLGKPNLSEAARWVIEIWKGGPNQHDADEFESAMGDLERALR